MANPISVQNTQSILSSLSAPQIAIIASAIGAVVASLIAALFSLLNTWIVKKAENERAIQELVIKHSIDLQKQHLELAKSNGKPFAILPIESYIINLVIVLKCLLNKKISAQNIPKLLDEIKKITYTANEHLKATRGRDEKTKPLH
mgnify:CR=1 FL=1